MNRRCQKLLEKARNSSKNYAFSDLLKLAECAGYALDTKRSHGGSHNKIYKRSVYPYVFNAQPDPKKHGQAKPAQVKELLKAIALTEEGDHN